MHQSENQTVNTRADSPLLAGSVSAWSDFTSAATDNQYYRAWLQLQSEAVAGSRQSVLLVIDGAGQPTPVAVWPPEASDPARLSDIMERVLEEQCGLLTELDGAQRFAIGYPFRVEEELYGVVAMEVVAGDEAGLQSAMSQLQWGISWLELLIRRGQVEEQRSILTKLESSVDLLALSLSREAFDDAAIAFTTELAGARGCERVSLGFMRGSRLRLCAVSHSAEVGSKMNLARLIERVMEEAAFQRRDVSFPALDETVLIRREHEALSRQQSMAAILTVPLFDHAGQCYGAVTCERAADRPFTAEDLEYIQAVASIAGTALESKYRNDLPLTSQISTTLGRGLRRLLGPGHLALKLFCLLVCAAVVFGYSVQGEYRLTADTEIEGSIIRAVVVPFDGFLDRAPARAGDVVGQGDTLAILDDRDLRLVKLARDSEHRQLTNQYQEAMATHDRAQAKIIKAQLEQSMAELELIDQRLARTRLTAPFPGLLVSGDLSQRLGSAVEQGDILFELTPLDGYRVILKVDERRIADVAVGQRGRLVLTSLPDHAFDFTVAKLTPIATAEEGRNYFRVEADLETADERLRPGMEGVGKIMVDKRRLVGIWSRNLIEWWQLLMWRWLP